MRRQAERAGRDRASALKSAASRCLSTLGLLSSGVVGVAASHPACERAGSIAGLSMPMCACVWDSLPIPALLSFGFAVRLAKGGCFHRVRVPNVTVESYTEGRKLSVPGRKQQEQLRVQRAWRPHSLRRSEHEPKECAGSLLRRGRVPNVAFESNMQQGYGSRGSSQPQKLRFPRFSRPHSFVYSEHQPKECAGSRKEKERNQRSAQKRRKRKKKGRTGGPRESFSAENWFERCLRLHSFAPHSEHQPKECEDRPNGLAVTELQR